MRLKQLFAAAALTLGAAALVGGCVDNRATLYINHVIAQEGSDGEGECEIDPGGDRFRGTGIWDPAVAELFNDGQYVAQLAIGNQMVPLGDNNVLQAETSRLVLRGAVVEVFDDFAQADASNGNSVASFTEPFAGTVQPDPSTDPGLVGIGVPILSTSLGLGDGRYIVRIRVFGETLGGQEIESGDFDFPVEIRTGSGVDCRFTEAEVAERSLIDPCGRVGQDRWRLGCAGSPRYAICDQFCN